MRRLTQMPISFRLPIVIAGLLFLSILVSSLAYRTQFQTKIAENNSALSETVSSQIEAQFEGWTRSMESFLVSFAENPNTSRAVGRLVGAISAPGAPGADEVRKAYLDDNPHPTGEKHNLNKAEDGSFYSEIHAVQHPFFRSGMEREGLYDLFIFDMNGLLVYSVFKEADYMTDFLAGPYAGSGLGEVYRQARETGGQIFFADYSPYEPSNFAPAAFLAHQIQDKDGNPVGVAAIQLPTDRIFSILENTVGLEAKDEVYLLGTDGLARSHARNTDGLESGKPVPALEHLETKSAVTADGNTSTIGLNGAPVIASVTSLDFFGREWLAVFEKDHETAFSQLSNFNATMLAFVGLGSLLSIGIGYLFASSITRPLAKFSDAMQSVANDDLDKDICGKDRLDEIGGLSTTLDKFRLRLLDLRGVAKRQEADRAEQARVVDELGGGLQSMADGDLSIEISTEFTEDYEQLRADFNSTVATIGGILHSVVDNAREISSRADEVSNSSDNLNARTENQAATLEETAAALQQLTESVGSAAQGASEADSVVKTARKEAESSRRVVEDAVEAMSQIKGSSDEISQIIGVIDDIAFQTNLLALNAGVEAARAGEAGRGFAVVASEVGALAQRSSEAAKQIKSLISDSSGHVESGVGLVGQAGDALSSIVARVAEIASLVEGIAEGAKEQASGLNEINAGVGELDTVTQKNASMVEATTTTAMTLKNEAASLNQLVARFRLGSNAKPAAPGRIVSKEKDPVDLFQEELNSRPAPSQPAAPKLAAQQAAVVDAKWQDF